MMLLAYIFLGCLNLVACLTPTEISHFGTSGDFIEAHVSVDSSAPSIHIIKASGMPDHVMSEIPIPIKATDQKYNISIPKVPTYNTGLHGCLPKNMIGITRTGVAIYNPLTRDNFNAVEGQDREIFDTCGGHPNLHGAYHYHKIPDSCLYKGEIDEFIGVALDGFPIYGPRASDVDHLITSADLDKCHGREVNGAYRYHATTTWPYFLGCYKGVVKGKNIQNSCDTSGDSGWEEDWTYYFCKCEMEENGDGEYPPPEECRMDNPNRPANCPDIEECFTDYPPMFCLEICAKRKPPPKFCQNIALPPDLTTKSMAVKTEVTQKTIVTTETGSQPMTSSPRPTRLVVVDRGSDDACSLTANVFNLVILIVFYVAFL